MYIYICIYTHIHTYTHIITYNMIALRVPDVPRALQRGPSQARQCERESHWLPDGVRTNIVVFYINATNVVQVRTVWHKSHTCCHVVEVRTCWHKHRTA